CEGEDAELLATGGSTYSWDNDLGSGDAQTVNPFETTTYIVTVTSADNCTDTDEVTIIVNPYPLIEISDDVAICPGEVTSITATGDGDVLWDNSPSSEETQEVSPDETTTYTALISNEFGCGASASVTVTVYELEELTISGLSDGAYCSIDENEYNMIGSPSGGTFSGNGVSGTQFTPANAGLGATEITYEYTDDNSCTSSVSQIVTIELCPNVAENGMEVEFDIWISNDQLFINTESDVTPIQSIELFDIAGKKIWGEDQGGNNFPLVRNLNALPAGIYVVQLKGQGWEASQSVLKR
ncbi:MAG: T9SS type A sorting domain-containing protein, partial [Bacteroidota bacterium]